MNLCFAAGEHLEVVKHEVFSSWKKGNMEKFSFEEVIFEGLLCYIFELLYADKPLNRNIFSPRLVNTTWSKLFQHPLQIFTRGGFDETLLRYPPSYYFRDANDWRIISQFDGMTKQV